MTYTQEMKIGDARSAIENLQVYTLEEGHIVAGANGTRIEIQVAPSKVEGSSKGSQLVSVMYPPVLAGAYPFDGVIFAPYFLEKMCRNKDNQMHWGDLYGTLEALRLVSGIEYVPPERAV